MWVLCPRPQKIQLLWDFDRSLNAKETDDISFGSSSSHSSVLVHGHGYNPSKQTKHTPLQKKKHPQENKSKRKKKKKHPQMWNFKLDRSEHTWSIKRSFMLILSLAADQIFLLYCNLPYIFCGFSHISLLFINSFVVLPFFFYFHSQSHPIAT